MASLLHQRQKTNKLKLLSWSSFIKTKKEEERKLNSCSCRTWHNIRAHFWLYYNKFDSVTDSFKMQYTTNMGKNPPVHMTNTNNVGDTLSHHQRGQTLSCGGPLKLWIELNGGNCKHCGMIRALCGSNTITEQQTAWLSHCELVTWISHIVWVFTDRTLHFWESQANQEVIVRHVRKLINVRMERELPTGFDDHPTFLSRYRRLQRNS